MLSELYVQHFGLIQHAEIDWDRHFNVLSGESGAGKSMLLGALRFILGCRVDRNWANQEGNPTEVTAKFVLPKHHPAVSWLELHELQDDNPQECWLRRTLSQQGTSKAYINGRPCSVQLLKQLAQHLIDMHSQHEHYSLLQPATQRQLVDDFGQLKAQNTELQQCFEQWQQLQKQRQTLLETHDASDSRLELLQYQVDELAPIVLSDSELADLEQEHRTLSQANERLSHVDHCRQLLCNEEHSVSSQLQSAMGVLQNAAQRMDGFDDVIQCLEQAAIHVDEAGSELEQLSQLEADPERLDQLDRQLSQYYDLARKHHVQPQLLHDHYQHLEQSLAALNNAESELAALQTAIDNAYQQAMQCAEKLSKARQLAAKKLQKTVQTLFKPIGLNDTQFEVSLEPTALSITGIDKVQFMIRTNPGQPQAPLHKIASGGELSRINLAIAVTTAKASQLPTLVFDEVDVGIGGNTAQQVGQALYDLSQHSQVICITHQPQVAAKCTKHLLVHKQIIKKRTQTSIHELNQSERINELVRMLGGGENPEHAIKHAESLLAV